MNAVYRAHPAPSTTLQSRAKAKDEDLWAFTCSSDAGGKGRNCDLCGPAAQGNYALNTTCRAEAVATHLHLYNRENDADDDKAKATFMALATKEFGLSTEVCHDNYGHEEPHDTSCWLGGPGGPGDSVWDSDDAPGGGGSFVTGHYSIYTINEDFAKVVGWVLQNNNAATFGKKIDYILHPTYGCNFADHQLWALYSGLTPNNLGGIAESGDFTGDVPPRLDPFGPSAHGADCTCTDRHPAGYDLHFLYDPTDEDASSRKDELASSFATAFPDASLVEDVPYSFANPKSPFLAGQVHFKLTNGIGSLMEWLAISGPANTDSVDVLLVPETCCGSLADYTQHALWAGRPWPLNTAVLSEATHAKSQGFLQRVGEVVGANSNYDFLLYVLYAADNSWQAAAVEEFVSAFSSEFSLTRKECSASTIEPSLDKLCMMSESSSPGSSDPMTAGYVQVYVPKASVEEVVSWAMTHRGADRNGYQVDLMMVPLSGEAVSDFNQRAFHVGTPWQVNQPALQ
jgi:aromatic ring-cleaving dioxygenase